MDEPANLAINHLLEIKQMPPRDPRMGTVDEMCAAKPEITDAQCAERAAPLRESEAERFEGRAIGAEEFRQKEQLAAGGSHRGSPAFAQFKKILEATKAKCPEWSPVCEDLLRKLDVLLNDVVASAPHEDIDGCIGKICNDYVQQPITEFLSSDVGEAMNRSKDEIDRLISERARLMQAVVDGLADAADGREVYVSAKGKNSATGGLDKAKKMQDKVISKIDPALMKENKSLRDTVTKGRQEQLAENLELAKGEAVRFCQAKLVEFEGESGKCAATIAAIEGQNKEIVEEDEARKEHDAAMRAAFEESVREKDAAKSEACAIMKFQQARVVALECESQEECAHEIERGFGSQAQALKTQLDLAQRYADLDVLAKDQEIYEHAASVMVGMESMATGAIDAVIDRFDERLRELTDNEQQLHEQSYEFGCGIASLVVELKAKKTVSKHTYEDKLEKFGFEKEMAIELNDGPGLAEVAAKVKPCEKIIANLNEQLSQLDKALEALDTDDFRATLQRLQVGDDAGRFPNPCDAPMAEVQGWVERFAKRSLMMIQQKEREHEMQAQNLRRLPQLMGGGSRMLTSSMTIAAAPPAAAQAEVEVAVAVAAAVTEATATATATATDKAEADQVADAPLFDATLAAAIEAAPIEAIQAALAAEAQAELPASPTGSAKSAGAGSAGMSFVEVRKSDASVSSVSSDDSSGNKMAGAEAEICASPMTDAAKDSKAKAQKEATEIKAGAKLMEGPAGSQVDVTVDVSSDAGTDATIEMSTPALQTEQQAAEQEEAQAAIAAEAAADGDSSQGKWSWN